jgi:YD repeat-containing protein
MPHLQIAFFVAVAAGAIPAPAYADVQYIYDKLNRLVAVIDPAGKTATYTYDAAGNVLAIGHDAVSQRPST